jgi:hypothetical protein
MISLCKFKMLSWQSKIGQDRVTHHGHVSSKVNEWTKYGEPRLYGNGETGNLITYISKGSRP